jgi:plastocyanin
MDSMQQQAVPRRPNVESLRAVCTAMLTLLPAVVSAGDLKGMVMEEHDAALRRPAAATATPANKDVVIWVTGIRTPAVRGTSPVLAQRNMTFSPSLLVVVAGQTVEMPNEDDVAHNVISSSAAKRFNLGIYPKGESRQVTFDQVGVVDVGCSVHKRMRANILVVPNAYYALTAAGGSYQIRGVPAGRYTVKAWRPDAPETSQEIDVPANGEVVRNFSIGAALAK